MAKIKSSVPGMKYPSGRDDAFKTAAGFMAGRRNDDGAEGLWRIYDNLYDLESFIKNHPGGSEWLEITRGTDITEAFETHHISDKAERLLPKFFVRKAVAPRAVNFTFEPNGFYITFKKRAYEALKGVDFHKPSRTSKLIADSLVTLTILAAITSVVLKSWTAMIFSSLFLAWSTVVAHNFFHMADNFRMYYFDLSLMSTRLWRISHSLSHHLYTNTIWDVEVYAFEPFLRYLPANKSILSKLRMFICLPIMLSISWPVHGIKRCYVLYAEKRWPEFRDIVPLLFPTILSFFAPSIFAAIKLWLCIIVGGSLIFEFIGVNAAHHHPEIFHDGDIYRDNGDWGLMCLDTVRDRNIIDDSIFLALTNFGLHSLHHLIPTVDHAYLNLCLPAFLKTCEEFGVPTDKMYPWQLVHGQFKQLVRTKPLANYRGGPDVRVKAA